jgi:hypothetical protein
MDHPRLRDALDPSLVRHMVASLMDDPSRVEGIAHDNGFHKLTLGRVPGGVVLRAHIWLEGHGFDETAGNIHNHRWSFVSRILQGAMTTVSFEVVRGGGLRVQHYTYRPGTDPEIRYVGPAHLRQMTAQTFADGDWYYLDAQTIHQAQPRAGLRTVTLVARSAAELECADVYATRHLPKAPGQSALLPQHVVAGEIRFVYDLLSRADGRAVR